MNDETAPPPAPSPEPPTDQHDSPEAHLLAALQGLRYLESRGDLLDRSWLGQAQGMIQMVLGLLSHGAVGNDPLTISPDRMESFAAVLREKRDAAELTQDQLAKLAGVSKRTIYNIEAARQAPSRDTLCRLLSVSQLKLAFSDFGVDMPVDPDWQPNSWFSPRYDPSQLMGDLVNLLNGPGGQIEQTYLYLEPQSANDYIALCSSSPVFVLLRNQAPLEQAAAIVAKRFAGSGVDVTALGSGDGRGEVRVVQALASGRGSSPDVRLYLLDISHTLLSVAYKLAKSTLVPVGIDVYALHANFHDLARFPVLHAGSSSRRRRLYTLLGGTMANLDNEIRFFQELGECAAIDDLCLIDIQLAVAPAEQPDEIRRLDPPLAPGYNAPHLKWMTGPLERHCQAMSSVSLRVDLTTHCPVPGSYELNNICHVKMRDGIERRFMMWRVRRYDAARLAQCLDELGWETLSTLKYGAGSEKTAAVMLLRRK